MFAIELACERLTQEELQKLCKACEAFRDATKNGDLRKIAESDVVLHDIIVYSTRNNRLIQLVNNLSEQMYRYRFEYIKDVSQHERLVKEHNDIYESILKKNKKAAADAVRRHIDNQEEAIIVQLQLGKDNSV